MAKYKKGDKIWVCSVRKSTGCVLKAHIPPTEIVLNEDINSSQHSALLNADWQGAKKPKYVWLVNIFRTEKETMDFYTAALTEVNKSLSIEIDRIQSYIKKYEGYKVAPPNKPVKKVKTNIEI